MNLPPAFLSDATQVFTLFLIPVGGGIPAGVVLAKARGISWPIMALLYFLSDVVLAIAFEPVLHLLIWGTKRSPRLSRMAEAYKASLAKSGFKYGFAGPFALIAISFGVDPMTGRAATKAAGHGFITGWLLAICGDMFYFALIMASTLWLNNILGNGTLATIIIMAAMIIVPILIERWKLSRTKSS